MTQKQANVGLYLSNLVGNLNKGRPILGKAVAQQFRENAPTLHQAAPVRPFKYLGMPQFDNFYQKHIHQRAMRALGFDSAQRTHTLEQNLGKFKDRPILDMYGDFKGKNVVAPKLLQNFDKGKEIKVFGKYMGHSTPLEKIISQRRLQMLMRQKRYKDIRATFDKVYGQNKWILKKTTGAGTEGNSTFMPADSLRKMDVRTPHILQKLKHTRITEDAGYFKTPANKSSLWERMKSKVHSNSSYVKNGPFGPFNKLYLNPTWNLGRGSA